MKAPSLQLVEDIFLQAIELSEAERRSFVVRETIDQPELRQEVEKLLAHHQDDSEGSNFILDRDANHLVDSDVEPPLDADPLGEQVGDQIGSYRLLEKIGEGGMGTVYMAEQTGDIHRKVALKIIKLGMDTRQVVARFEAERQAMALFDHPGIARVFDAGSTAGGRPYFVMELIRGQDIITFCQQRKLDLTDRLKVFVATCEAVQHAHQKGIIHRDIKPTNILVTMLGGAPAPKVIDFGIAKAIGQKLTEKTLFTRYASMVGTPQYMSPEQAELSGHDVDTRSDVYSLGVLLYELLTGTTPLAPEELNTMNPMALYETLRDSKIETPSSQISRATNEGIFSPAEIQPNRRLRNELDWVVMKALAQDRVERYATANELAADVRRFLEGDPVSAMPPSRFHRIRAWIGRNRRTTLAIVVVTLLVCGWALSSSILAFNTIKLNEQLSSALEDKQRSLDRAIKAEQEISRANAELRYNTAHSITESKFNARYSMDLEDTYLEVFESSLDKLLPKDDEEGRAAARAQLSLAYSFVCMNPNLDGLLTFPSFDDNYNMPVASLRQYFSESEDQDDKVDNFYESLSEDNPGSDFDEYEKRVRLLKRYPVAYQIVTGAPPEFFSDEPKSKGKAQDDDDHTEICLVVGKEMEKQLDEHRVLFYRLLVSEYRLSFGENDPRVSEALTLLAASLAEVGKNHEAEPHLREAIALLPADKSQPQRKLLAEILGSR